MSDLISKLTSYNLFNNLVPGVVFSYASSGLGLTTPSTEHLATDFIIFYFVGVLISRFGSLFVEPVLRYTGIAVYADYSSYLTACEKDKKIEALVEDNNQYRTYIALFVLLALSLGFEVAASKYGLTDMARGMVLLAVALALFIMAYRKQTSFIYKRVSYSSSIRKVDND